MLRICSEISWGVFPSLVRVSLGVILIERVNEHCGVNDPIQAVFSVLITWSAAACRSSCFAEELRLPFGVLAALSCFGTLHVFYPRLLIGGDVLVPLLDSIRDLRPQLLRFTVALLGHWS